MTEPVSSTTSETSDSSVTSIDDLIQRLKARVEERRAAGEYPEGLESELEEHFNRIVFHRHKSKLDQLEADVTSLDSHMLFTADSVELDTSIPGGAIVQKALNRALAQTHAEMTKQVHEFAIAVRRVIRTIAQTVQDPSTHVHGDLLGQMDAMLERLNAWERSPANNEAAIGDLRRRVEELERAEAARQFKPFFTNTAFEEHFRDPNADFIESKNYGELADEVHMDPIVDVGCGRGEFVQLMKSRGFKDVWGIELDSRLVKEAQEDGLDVRDGDGLKILGALPNESLGTIVLLQVIEHLTIQQQLDLVLIAFDKLKPGGRIIVESVNPQSLYNYAHAFFIDPTHTRPVHPAYLSFVFEQAGFGEVKWQWRNAPPVQDVLELDGDDENTPYNRNVKRLNQLLFDAMDYALIVTK